MMRASGDGFFIAAETKPYQPSGALLGQQAKGSCAAACCRMLLLDQSPEARDDYKFSESFIRGALGTDEEGTVISRIPDVLKSLGLAEQYVYRKDLSFEELRALILTKPAIAIMRARDKIRLHALIIEKISRRFAAIRDPLPEGRGAAYRIPLDLFLPSWRDPKTQRGAAVVVVQ